MTPYDEPPAAAPAADPQSLMPAAPTDPDLRLEWLFRDSARRRVVHPLLALVRAYRTAQTP